ncbi:DsbA family protein [Streptomyces sp. NPDC093546]|uniref:DsbA family oxidoreductase n=1 Tax=Streptomyces sp. NPDC093546 TaxID=3366040 RepID=UPI0037F3BEE8
MTAVTTIDVWFDYICPFSVMTRKVLADAVTDPDVRTVWRAYELHPEGTPPPGEGDYPERVWENSVLPMAERLGVRLGSAPSLPLPRTGLALRGHRYAERHGAGLAYSDRVFDAHFLEHLDIADPGPLGDLAADVGLDAREFRAYVTSAAAAEQYLREQEEARRTHRIHTVPTLTIGTWRTEGVPRADRVREVLAALRPPAGGSLHSAGAATRNPTPSAARSRS